MINNLKKKEMKAYLAGPLFSKAEIRQRKEEAQLLRDTFKDKLKLFSPIEASFNNDKSLTSNIIFQNDKNEIDSSNIFVFDLHNISDIGTFTELGIAIQRKEQNEDILIIAMLWDLRQFRDNPISCFYEQGWGYNQFVIGALKKNGYLVQDINEAIPLIEKFMNK